MTITPSDAEQALRDILQAEERGARLRSYRRGAPHLMLWGVLWFVGYFACFFWPGRAGLIWDLLVVLGVLGNIAISRHAGGQGSAWWRGAARILAVFVFIVASLLVLRPVDPLALGAFIPLMVALVYLLLGLDRAPRLAVTGVALAGLTLIGWFGFRPFFLPWMGSVGAASLFLGGLWLRRV